MSRSTNVTFGRPVSPTLMQVCFRWGTTAADPFFAYPAYTVWVLALTGVEALEGSTDYAVVGTPKAFRFDGSGVGVQSDRASWVTAGPTAPASCAGNVTVALALVTVDMGGPPHAVFTFPGLYDELWLCYQFGLEPPVLVPDVITLHTRQVTGVTPASGLLVVAGVPTSFTVTGTGISAGDRLRWSAVAGSCAESDRAPGSADVSVAMFGDASVNSTRVGAIATFAQHSEGALYHACYSFSNNGTVAEPWFMLPAPAASLQVVVVSAMAADTGGGGDVGSGVSVVVVGVVSTSMRLTLQGSGMSSLDSVRFSTVPGSCDEAHAAPGVPSQMSVTTAFSREGMADPATGTNSVEADVLFLAPSNGTTWSLCYRWGGPGARFYSVAGAAVAVKELAGLATDSGPVRAGESVVAVVGTPTRIRLLGDGLSTVDRVKFVAGPEPDCSSGGMGGGAGVSDLAFALEEEVEANGDTVIASTLSFATSSSGSRWFLCFRAGGTNAYHLFRNSTVSVNQLLSAVVPQGASGAAGTAVDGVPKTLVFGGDGVGAGDVAVFVSPEDACSVVADGGDGAANHTLAGYPPPQTVGVGRSATFVFTFGTEPGRLPPTQPLQLCYAFSSVSFVRYASITMTVKSLLGLVSTSGGDAGSGVAVVSLQEDFTVSGVGMASGDVMFWVGAEATHCGSPTHRLGGTLPSDGVVTRVDERFRTSFTFSQGSSGLAWRLCYAFGSEPFTLYPSITMEVRQVSGVRAVSAGDSNVVVVGVPKTLWFEGSNLLDGDRLGWVPQGSPCQASAVTSTPIVNSSAVVLFTAANASVATRWVACYRFKDEGVVQVPTVSVIVKSLLGVTSAVVGAPPWAAVVGMNKQLLFAGHETVVGDRVLWINAESTTCPPASSLQPGDTVPLSTFGTLLQASFTFSSATGDPRDDANALRLCYYHGREPARLYDGFRMHVLRVMGVAHANVTARRVQPEVRGGQLVSVVGQADGFMFYGAGVGSGMFSQADRVMWVSAAAQSDSDCVQGLAAGLGTGAKEAWVAVSAPGTAANASMTFADGHAALQLCYKFGDLPYKLYNGYRLAVATITSPQAVVGRADVAVAGLAKRLRWQGTGLVPGDVGMWVFANATSSRHCTAGMAFVVGAGTSSTAVVDASLASSFTFRAPENARTALYPAQLCYSFLGSSFVLFPSVTLDVRHVKGLFPPAIAASPDMADRLAVLRDGNVAVVGVEKVLVVHGFGLASGDAAYWAIAASVDAVAASGEGNGCAPAAGTAAVGAPAFTVSLDPSVPDAVGAPSFVTRFVFTNANMGSRLLLCYQFGTEGYVPYPSIALSVQTVENVVADGAPLIPAVPGASANVAVAGTAKRLRFVGPGVGSGDCVLWVLPSATGDPCSASNALPMRTSVDGDASTSPVVTSDDASVVVVFDDARLGLQLCYKHGTEPFALYVALTLVRVWCRPMLC